MKDEGLKSAYQDADKYNWTKAELEAYDYALMREQDHRGSLSSAYKKGIREGITKVREDIARSLFKTGLSTQEIAVHTQLTTEQVEKLREQA